MRASTISASCPANAVADDHIYVGFHEPLLGDPQRLSDGVPANLGQRKFAAFHSAQLLFVETVLGQSGLKFLLSDAAKYASGVNAPLDFLPFQRIEVLDHRSLTFLGMFVRDMDARRTNSDHPRQKIFK